MPVKILSSVIAFALVLAFLMPMVIKLKEIALGGIVLVVLVMMLVDLKQSLTRKD